MNVTEQEIEQEIASLFIIGFSGDHPRGRHHILRDIKLGLGGVILFDRLLALGLETNNICSPERVKQLTEQLQSVREQPLLIAVDQEGGMVSRFKEKFGFPVTRSPQELGLSEEDSRKAALQTAIMLKDAGLNWNLAPSADLNINPENPVIGHYGRSFSENGEKVAIHNHIWHKELQAAGVFSCLKHFPGHGSSKSDSHLGFVDITETWTEDELIPYKKMIAQDEVDAIMVGHLMNKTWDSQYPATMSPATIEILRKDLSYKGLLISDDMQMGAITAYYGLEEACYRAIKAGLDMLIIGNNLHYDSEILPKMIKYLKNAVATGRLSHTRIKEAADRVKNMQDKLRRTA